jgi:hypothetical protein
MSRLKYALLGLMVLAIAGCSKTSNQNTAQQQPEVAQQQAQPAPTQAGSENTPEAAQQTAPPAQTQATPRSAPQAAAPASPRMTAGSRQPSRAAQAPRVAQETQQPAAPSYENQPAPPTAQALEAPTAPKAPEPRYATITSGTSIQIRLQEPLDSGVNKTGDTFRAILDRNIEVDGKVVAPRGSILEGKLTSVEQSGRLKGRAAMSLQLDKLIIDNQSYPVQTETLSFEAQSTAKKDATKVGLGAGIGAVIGAIAGGGKGAAIGAAVGGGAGGATVIATRGKELQFEAEHRFAFTLSRDVSVRLP